MASYPSGSSSDQPATRKARVQAHVPTTPRICFTCNASVDEQFVLAVDFQLVEVCEICYLCKSIEEYCGQLEIPAQRALSAHELRSVYTLLRSLTKRQTTCLAASQLPG